MKEKVILPLISLLVFVLLATSIPVNAMNLEDETNAEEEYEMLWGLSQIYVTVEEIYGDVDNPQYRPLPDVKVRCIGFNFNVPNPEKFTDENGRCNYYIPCGIYLFKATKDGYTDISSGLKGFRIMSIGVSQEYSFTFTLAEDGSAFVQHAILQSNPSSQPSNQFVQRILQQFPNMFPILRNLFDLE